MKISRGGLAALGLVCIMGSSAISHSNSQTQQPAPWQQETSATQTTVAWDQQATATAQAQTATAGNGTGTGSKLANNGPTTIQDNHLTPGPGQRLLTFVNDLKPSQTIWVGGITTPGINPDTHLPYPPITTTGWVVEPGHNVSTLVPRLWDGRIWGRTGCNFDSNGNGKCSSGDCGAFQCTTTAQIPTTLAEFNLNEGENGAIADTYDISLVDGSNLPLYINTIGGSPSTPDRLSANGCMSTPFHPGGPTGCTKDVNTLCAASQYSDLQVKDAAGNVVACKSACTMFILEGYLPNSPEADPYCCPGNGSHGVPQTCQPNTWPPNLSSETIFKDAEPFAYSYAYDDQASTLQCAGSCGYRITFGVSS